MTSNKHQQGVTLLELIVVMIIVGVLAAIAIPTYRSYVMRSQRTDAKEALLALATQQEKFYLQCNMYADAIGNAPSCAGAGTLQGAATSQNGWYTLVTNGDAVSYTATATAAVGENQFQDEACREYTITDRGIRSAENAGGTDNTAECWR